MPSRPSSMAFEPSAGEGGRLENYTKTWLLLRCRSRLRRRFRRLGRLRVGIACRLDVELDATVVLTTLVGLVRIDRLLEAEALRSHALLVDAERREPLHDRC